MITYCHVMKNKIFTSKCFRVFWSRRGRWCASTTAGSLPGVGCGYMESTAGSVTEALQDLDHKLEARKAELLEKVKEIDAALFEIRADGYKAEELEQHADRPVSMDYENKPQ